MDDIDYENTIFIIDSTTCAFMVSIISMGKPINCIIECKKEIDNERSVKLLNNFASKCILFSKKREIWVSSPFFIEDEGDSIIKKIKKINRFRKSVEEAYAEEKNKCYIGPPTSSIMRCLKCNPENIYYLHHGSIDSLRYMKTKKRNTNKESLYKKIREWYFSKMMKMPNSQYAGYFSIKGYSMTDLNTEDVVWLNYENFSCDAIENTLKSLPILGEHNVLFCPISDFHHRGGVNPDNTEYDDQNLNMIKDIIEDSETILLKYHPSLYTLSDHLITDLDNRIEKEFHIKAYDVCKYIPESIGGELLPLEVIIRYCDIKKLICVETSTIWNVSKTKKIKKYSDIRSTDGLRREILLELFDHMKNTGVVNESYTLRK